MAWKPSKDFPLIIEDLKKRGHTKEATLSQLRLSIIEVLGYLTEKPLQNMIRLLEDFNYIRQTSFVNTWEIVQKKPFDMRTESRECDKIIEAHIKDVPVVEDD